MQRRAYFWRQTRRPAAALGVASEEGRTEANAEVCSRDREHRLGTGQTRAQRTSIYTRQGGFATMHSLLHFLRSFGRRCFLRFGLCVFPLSLFFSAIPPTFYPVTAQPIKFASFSSPASLLPLCFIPLFPFTPRTNPSRCPCSTLSPQEMSLLLFILIPTCLICGPVTITSSCTKTPCPELNVAQAVHFALNNSSSRVQSWTAPVL